MTITRQIFSDSFSQAPQSLLFEVLSQAGLKPKSIDGSEALAESLANKLWWKAHTPLGYQLRPHTLESIVSVYAQKLELQIPEADGWRQLDTLTDLLLPPDENINIQSLSPELQKRVTESHWKTTGGAASSATAAGTRWAATHLLGWTSGAIWKWLRLVPKLGPVIIGIRTAAGWIAAISGPVAIASAIYTVNQALGPRWDDALGLLLGAGLIRRGNTQLVQPEP